MKPDPHAPASGGQRRPPPITGTLQFRIVVFLVALLVTVLAVGFYAARYAILKTAEETLRTQLRIGAYVFNDQLQENSQQLVEATGVLTYDFGFREAVATRDRDTILSALNNHAARIKASGMSVVGLDGITVADTLAPEAAGKPYPFADLVSEASEKGRTSGVRLLGGKPYQVLIVPVLAPLPIAWVSMAFVIDDRQALDLKRKVSSDVTFVGFDDPAGRRLLSTTLSAEGRSALMEKAHEIVAAGSGGTTVLLQGQAYQTLATPLAGSGAKPLYAILQRSLEDELQPFYRLQANLLFVGLIALVVTLLGANRITRRITRPISELAGAAREIERGNYGVRVQATGGAELAELVRAFESMARGLTERDNVRDVLGKVASSDVVNELLTGQIDLRGEEREATVIFTDLRNFTSLAERLPASQTFALLNEYLTEISDIIESHGGVVDKYLGDGLMAIFGAPVARADDAQRAVEATLAIRDGVRRLGASLAGRGLPNPGAGVGVNTSRLIAGNIGSPSRLNYTVLGDGVNLASRLEGLTKRYQVPIVAGELTRASVSGFVFRELDKVRVRGRMQPVRIYEPLCRESELPALEREPLGIWEAALEDFRAREFQRARVAFEHLESEPGYSRLVQIYLGYLADLEARPPGADWDGAFTLYEK